MAFKLKDLIISLRHRGGDQDCIPPSADFGDRPDPAEMCFKVLMCNYSPAILVMPKTILEGCGRPSAGFHEKPLIPRDLADLKRQLEQVLAEGERQESAAAEPHLPQTVEEAEQLETRLREALEELQRHKEGLKG